MGLVIPLSFFTTNGLTAPILTNFDPSPPSIYAVTIVNDDTIAIGGEFISVNGQSRRGLAFLDNKGNLKSNVIDLEYRTGGVLQPTPGRAFQIKLQADGKILVCGGFDHVNGVARSPFIRLNTDLTIDTTFAPSFIPSYASVYCMAIQADGKILFGDSTQSVYRCSSTGVKETGTFATITNTVANSIAIQSTGKIIVGSTSSVSGILSTTPVIRRFNTNGTLDATFAPDVSVTEYNLLGPGSRSVDHIEMLPDDSMYISGNFTTVSSLPTPLVAKLNSLGSLVEFTNKPVFYDGFFEPTISDICYSHRGKFRVSGVTTVAPVAMTITDDVGFGPPDLSVGSSVCFLTHQFKTSMAGTNLIEGQEYFIYDHPLEFYPEYFRVSTKNRLIDPSAVPITVGTAANGLVCLSLIPHKFELLSSYLLLNARVESSNPFDANYLPAPLANAYTDGGAYIPFLFTGYKPFSFKLRKTPTGTAVNITERWSSSFFGTYKLVGFANATSVIGRNIKMRRIKEVDGQLVVGGKFNYCFDVTNINRSSSGPFHWIDERGNLARFALDGTRDNSFDVNLSNDDPNEAENAVMDIAVTADNEIIVGGSFQQDRTNLAKIESTGLFLR